mmetsp:Transcript_16984/g.14458  ORF Transcript_16984/g.14458 Transcript_16984/m.14458 type:complete len:91 (+) Transcript_16984:58-330(+)
MVRCVASKYPSPDNNVAENRSGSSFNQKDVYNEVILLRLIRTNLSRQTSSIRRSLGHDFFCRMLPHQLQITKAPHASQHGQVGPPHLGPK